MSIEQAWLLKGFVLAHNASAEVIAAADAVIASTTKAEIWVTGPAVLPLVGTNSAIAPDSDPSETPTPEAKKKRHQWSPEAKAAASERMRAMQARKKAEREGRPPPAAAEPAPRFTVRPRRITSGRWAGNEVRPADRGSAGSARVDL